MAIIKSGNSSDTLTVDPSSKAARVTLYDASGNPISGQATSAKQDLLLAELQLKADLTETQPVSAASLPLPSGAATSAKQDLLLAELQLKADLTDTQPVSAIPVELEIAKTGMFKGKAARIIDVLGRRSTFASAILFQDVVNYLVGGQDLYNIPNSATTYYLVSTSNNDKAGSPGAITVRIYYLDSAGDQQVTTKTLNGTTQVNIGNGYSFIEWMEVASLTAGTETAAGDITIGSVNGAATEATTIEMIKAGGNRSLSGRYKIPTGYSGYLLGMYGAAINQAMDLRMRATVFSSDRAISDVYHFQNTAYLASGTSLEKDMHYQKLPAGSIVKMSCIPSATTGNPRCDANFHLLIIAD